MAEQSNQGSFNFQHGDTYLSPSEFTAVRYAIDKEYGSELLTYTINFLKELIKLNLPEINGDLFRTYPQIFGLIEARPSPLLVEIRNVRADSLTDEHGNDPSRNFKTMSEVIGNASLSPILQQVNFRLTAPYRSENLRFYLINVTEWHHLLPKYNLYEIELQLIDRSGPNATKQLH